MLTETDKRKIRQSILQYATFGKGDLVTYTRLKYSYLGIPAVIQYTKEQYNRYILLGEINGKPFKTSD